MAILAIGLASSGGVRAADPISSPNGGGASRSATTTEYRRTVADFAGAAASADAHRVADWVVASADARDLPFVIVDKVAAKLFVFDRSGMLLGASPALLGLARGDVSPPGIGDRPLASIGPADRITPAGRFLASHGHDLGEKDIVWVDYAAAISLHRVVTKNPAEARLHRLATPSALDNRISYGCINVPAAFYDDVIGPLFSRTDGFVYILPEVKSVEEIFSGAGSPNAVHDRAAKSAKPLRDDQLDRVSAGARQASGKPIIIGGG